MFDFLRRFMNGRYGNDQLNQFCMWSNLVLLLLWTVTRFRPIAIVILFVIVFCYYRMFSRDIQRRYAENQRFLRWWMPVRKRFTDAWARFRDRKVHRYYKCPACRSYLRVPRGRGKINIKCPKCGRKFVKKS